MINRILQLMNDNNVNARQLTLELELSTNAISEWKKGKAKPSTDAIIKLSNYFNVSTDYLLKGDNQHTENKVEILNDYEKLFLSKIRAGYQPMFDEDIKILTGDVGRLKDREYDMILKFRKLSEADKQDAYEIIDLKYNRGLVRKIKSSTSTNGKDDMVG